LAYEATGLSELNGWTGLAARPDPRGAAADDRKKKHEGEKLAE
jgi:hypothetical protein